MALGFLFAVVEEGGEIVVEGTSGLLDGLGGVLGEEGVDEEGDVAGIEAGSGAGFAVGGDFSGDFVERLVDRVTEDVCAEFACLDERVTVDAGEPRGELRLAGVRMDKDVETGGGAGLVVDGFPAP